MAPAAAATRCENTVSGGLAHCANLTARAEQFVYELH